MTAFADLLDLRTAVVEIVKSETIVDVFPRLVRLAETDFNRRLRCREQITEVSVTVSGGTVALPSDFSQALGLFDGAGREMANLSQQGYKRLSQKTGFYSIGAGAISAADADYTLSYYAKVPTIADALTDTNWLLTKHPELYLYAVASKAAKHMLNIELARDTTALALAEYAEAEGQDEGERYARATVRLVGVTP
jgi:hypothetical protein